MIYPDKNDVVFGKGFPIQKRPGNQHYHWLIESVKPVYDQVPKRVKHLQAQVVVNEILDKLEPPGRFLKKNKDTGEYELVDRATAVLKARQALRDWKPRKRKQIWQRKQNSNRASSNNLPIRNIADEHELLTERSKRMKCELDDTISAYSLIHSSSDDKANDNNDESIAYPSPAAIDSWKTVLKEYAMDPYNVDNINLRPPGISKSMHKAPNNNSSKRYKTCTMKSKRCCDISHGDNFESKRKSRTNTCARNTNRYIPSKLSILVRVMEERLAY